MVLGNRIRRLEELRARSQDLLAAEELERLGGRDDSLTAWAARQPPGTLAGLWSRVKAMSDEELLRLLHERAGPGAGATP